MKTIYHGSDRIIEKPKYGFGRKSNDYGRGFYCTENKELSKEWACKNGENGFSNAYQLDLDDLSVCNLNAGDYNILNWLAVLTKNRSYWQRNSIAEEAKYFLQEHYYVDVDNYDVIVGYRADDSYFSFAQDFIMGTISLQKLSRAMRLGNLGEQIVLKSQKAFEHLKFESFEMVYADEFYLKKSSRDKEARRQYREDKRSLGFENEIYIVDIMRGADISDELFI